MTHRVGQLALVFTLASVALLGCSRPAEQPPIDSPIAAEPDDEPSEPATTIEPVAPAAADPIFYFVGSQLWRMEADGSQARALGLQLNPAGYLGGAVGEGDNTPTVSRDGRWVAWTDEVDLWVAELGPDGPRREQLTTMPPIKDNWIVAAEVSYSTWSPDGSTLVVILREPGYAEDDPLPLPAGVKYGFHTLRTTDLALVHAEHIEGFYGWTPDSKAVLNNKYIARANYELLAQPIDPGPAKLLRKSNDDYGFSQLRVTGEWLAWNTSGHGSQIVIALLSGGEPKPMSPRAAFADIQWPAVAPDGAHVLFEWKQTVHLGAGPDPSAAKPLAISGQRRWLDAKHLLTITPDGLVVMDLDGEAKVLDPNGTHLVRQ